ncbi:CHAT domain-containing protein [Sorangium sp. So ce296]|uniref:CHAT domain-containing protein n=1 Tax=Sorangium sp. So ce296 TaxID=3133296 RepID=UPI003F5E9976
MFEQLRRSKSPHVVHFLGHGTVAPDGRPMLRLADDDGEEAWISAGALAQELSASFGEDLRLVVLEACEGAAPGAFGSAAEILARAGANAVVAHLPPPIASIPTCAASTSTRTTTTLAGARTPASAPMAGHPSTPTPARRDPRRIAAAGACPRSAGCLTGGMTGIGPKRSVGVHP